MTRSTVLSGLILALTLALSLPAGAGNPKNEVLVQQVSLGPANGIESELVAVPDKYAMKPDRYALHLTLVELRSSGENVFLGEQTVLLSDTTLLTENGPDGRDVVDVFWVTQLVFDNSRIQACAEAIDTMTGMSHGELTCQTLDPAF